MLLVVDTIQALTSALLALLIIVLFLIVLVLIYGINNYRLLRNQGRWANLIENKIAIAILDGSSSLLNDPELILLLKNKEFGKLFLSILIASDKKFSGDAHQELEDLFYLLKLDQVAIGKLRSNDIYKKIRGMQALRAMKVQDSLNEITPLLKHSHSLVLAEAQYTIVRLKGFMGLSFLESSDEPMSRWQQIRILRSVNEVPQAGYSLIVKLVENNNQSVVEFALFLIRKFRLTYFHQHVFSLLFHPIEDIRVLAIKTLSDIETENTINQLLDSYNDQPEKIKNYIINAIRSSNAKEHADFLVEELLKEYGSSLRIAISNALVAFGRSDSLKSLLNTYKSDRLLCSIINHALKVKL